MRGPLAGVRVVEMANVISGPYAGMLLADLGAEVIKVEMPGSGDVFRLWDGESGEIRPQFAAYNRNKRSVTIDVRKPGGRQVYRRLAATADVVVENFRPGTLEQWGVGYPQLCQSNPRLVYCAITGMGSTGPERDRPTYDAIAQAISGLWSQFTDWDRPEPLGPPLCDQLAGIYAVYGILAALVERAQSGRGQRIEVSMVGAGLAFQPVPVADWTVGGEVSDKRARPRRSQSYAFVAADGKPLAIHLSTPEKFWRGLAAAVERPDLLEDPRFSDKRARIRNYDALAAELAAVFRSRPRQAWLQALAAHDVPAAPILTIPEALEHPQVKALGLLQTYGSGDRALQLVGVPVQFGGTPPAAHDPPPRLGEHTAAVLAELGYQSGEVEALRAEGAV